MLSFQIVDEKNVNSAIEIQNLLFPKENGEVDLKEASIGRLHKHQFLQKYWLVNYENAYIGIVGLYAYTDYPKDAWLGWFGIIKKF